METAVIPAIGTIGRVQRPGRDLWTRTFAVMAINPARDHGNDIIGPRPEAPTLKLESLERLPGDDTQPAEAIAACPAAWFIPGPAPTL